MGGLYVQCGEYGGEDKSMSAISGVLGAIAEGLSGADKAAFMLAFRPLIDGDVDEEGVELGAEHVRLLEAPLRAYYAALGEKLGHPEPWEAPDLDGGSVDAKYGAGDGWRYYCAHDLLQACEVHREQEGEPIVIFYM
ncbi:MAG: hypothetical protein KC613_10970 [Myxococcales bacterium]|nr:hypothetical protein [Myxococcales bacterium]MCB9525974.1 hypothetical protein [Myxococcales bacterium]